MSQGSTMLASKRIRLIGAPMDLGAGRRGVDMGPSALRVAELGPRARELGYTVEDFGNVRVKLPEQQEHGDSNLKYKGPILDTCTELAVAVEKSLDDGSLPVVLGGDHSVAIGSTAVPARVCPPAATPGCSAPRACTSHRCTSIADVARYVLGARLLLLSGRCRDRIGKRTHDPVSKSCRSIRTLLVNRQQRRVGDAHRLLERRRVDAVEGVLIEVALDEASICGRAP